ncbi:hypothetical protein TNCV_939351 [Trichonephila clavipes]|nr:hypothetical protein TNCV_939351 [Trichonephila clavipes]
MEDSGTSLIPPTLLGRQEVEVVVEGGLICCTAGIVVILLYIGNEHVKLHPVLPMKSDTFSKDSSIECYKADSLIKQKSGVHKSVYFSKRLLVMAITAKCLGGPPIDRDRLDAHPEFKSSCPKCSTESIIDDILSGNGTMP